jgi:hypothetical protein
MVRKLHNPIVALLLLLWGIYVYGNGSVIHIPLTRIGMPGWLFFSGGLLTLIVQVLSLFARENGTF